MFLPEYKEVLTPNDVMEILGVGRNCVYKMLKEQEIKSHMIGGKYKIPKFYIYQFLYPDSNDYDKEAYDGEA